MADRGLAGEAPDDVVAVKIACDMALRAVAVKLASVIAGDASGLLAAVLQRVKPKCNNRRRRVGAPDTENAAFLAQLVVVKRIGGQHARLAPSLAPLARI